MTIVTGMLALSCAVPGTHGDAPSPATTPADAAGAMPTLVVTSTPDPFSLGTMTVADEIILTVTSPIARGGVATANVLVVHDADCTIRVLYDSGPSTARGLEPKAADGSGHVSWSWTVEAEAPFGSWPVEVNCGTPSGQRAVARQLLTVR